MHKESVLPRNSMFNTYTGGVVNWRTWLVDKAAKAAGLLVHVEGMPLGTTRNLDPSVLEINPRSGGTGSLLSGAHLHVGDTSYTIR